MALLSHASDRACALIVDNPWLSLIGFLTLVLYTCRRGPNLSHIPTAGYSGILSYWDGLCFINNAKKRVDEGYAKFRGGMFKIALPTHWQVLVASLDLVDELRTAKDSDLSLTSAGAELMQAKYTVGQNIFDNSYHKDVVQTPLTRNLVTKFDEIYEEIASAFEDLVPANEKDWLGVRLAPTVLQVVCRTSNRLFIGLPLCRNPEWVNLNIDFTVEAFMRGTIIGCFPNILKPIVGRLISPSARAMKIGRKYLAEEVKQRIQMDDEYGKNYDGRPNDLISWLLEFAQGEERTVDRIIQRIFAVNVAAIHTSSNSLTIAILNLAARPEYIEPMREEVAEVVDQHGWTKAGLNKMRKVDSFLKESARYEGIMAMQINRMVINPDGYTFRNGQHLPYGTFVGVPTDAIHHDPEYHEDPQEFDGFRYSKMRDDGGEGVKHQMVSTSLSHVNFSHGKHACPGRFFAANELKTILAHLVLTYDIALSGDSKPKLESVGFNLAPSDDIQIMFRRLPT